MTEHRAPGPGDHLAIRDDSDVAVARRRVRELGAQEALPPPKIAALETAVTEIARNILVHAGKGEISFGTLADGERRGVAVLARDWGPGIADVAQAMQDGYSTGDGLGLGLAGARRLVDEFEIDSIVGAGVTVTLKQWNDAIDWGWDKPL
jgi:serine/threonine-protein kinase RsbT